jgi:hypothetical protein
VRTPLVEILLEVRGDGPLVISALPALLHSGILTSLDPLFDDPVDFGPLLLAHPLQPWDLPTIDDCSSLGPEKLSILLSEADRVRIDGLKVRLDAKGAVSDEVSLDVRLDARPLQLCDEVTSELLEDLVNRTLRLRVHISLPFRPPL